ncbi:Alpha/Beta hydrolase protein [Rhizoctonia solani]|nr:Alpha/Beta hydrolase protein [Rhizoctonia solani]
MVTKLEQVAQNKAFGGSITKYKFVSEALGGLETHFNLFVPEGASSSAKVPVVTYLAGLTCNEDTAPWKSGLLLPASQHSLALLFPDTSPRGAQIATEDDSWDFGTGAGFYLNATASDWSKNYNMEKLITSEIQQALKDNTEVGGVLDLDRQSVMGHSMGGHGAITLYLKGLLGSREGVQYKAASGFAPILNPTKCPWGEKAFKGYLKVCHPTSNRQNANLRRASWKKARPTMRLSSLPRPRERTCRFLPTMVRPITFTRLGSFCLRILWRSPRMLGLGLIR